MKNKLPKFESQETTYHRPPHPRQYRSKNSNRSKERRVPEKIDTTLLSAEHDCTSCLGNPIAPALQCTKPAPQEEIIAQIRIESEYQWGFEAEDSEDFNPYTIDVLQDPDPEECCVPNFEWVAIKQEIKEEPPEPPIQIKKEELDLDDIGPNCAMELPPIAFCQHEIKVEPWEQVADIKQEELDLTETEYPQYANMDAGSLSASALQERIETISVDDDETDEDDLSNHAVPSSTGEHTAETQPEIGTICVDDSDDEPPCEELKIERNEPVQKSTPVDNSKHTCIPRRLYPRHFVMRFIEKTVIRGYSIIKGELLNGARDEYTYIFKCDICNQQAANPTLIREHLLIHALKTPNYQSHLFITNECRLCHQRHLNDLGLVWLHFDQKHSKEMHKAAQGQKFAVHLECRICRRWLSQVECMECGESYDRRKGISWHHKMHRTAERFRALDSVTCMSSVESIEL